MRIFNATLLFVAATSLVAAGGVETLHDAEADFSAYTTYQWMESKDVPQIPQMREYLIKQIDAQLQAAGLKKVESDGDLKVGARVVGTIETSASRSYTDEVPWTVGYVWRGDRSISENTLVVDVIDVAANHAVWQGVANKTFYDQDRQNYGRLQNKIGKIVSKMFSDFPPKPGK